MQSELNKIYIYSIACHFCRLQAAVCWRLQCRLMATLLALQAGCSLCHVPYYADSMSSKGDPGLFCPWSMMKMHKPRKLKKIVMSNILIHI